MDWSQRSSEALALLDADAHHWDGSLIYVDAGCLLRRQWAETATLESSSSSYVLGTSRAWCAQKRCAALTNVEGRTHIDQVGKTNSNLTTWLLLAAMLVGLALPARAQAPASGCNVSLDQVRLANPLPRFAHKLASEELITIVAIGSSSTAGAGASSAAASYPNRLAVELK